MFQYAATNFGDANAQYNLGRLYLDGSTGVDRDTRQAARWLSLAAEKGNAPAQALLGQMLFNGRDGVARQRARGLMWLTLALDAATPPKDQWIVELYENAIKAASDPDRQMALAYLEAHLQKRD
jgi:TPR repeat protein